MWKSLVGEAPKLLCGVWYLYHRNKGEGNYLHSENYTENWTETQPITDTKSVSDEQFCRFGGATAGFILSQKLQIGGLYFLETAHIFSTKLKK